MHIELRCPEDLDVLKQLQRQERNAKQRDRYRAVLLALNGKTAPEIAAKLDRSRRFVQQWIYRYRDDGLANLTEQPRRVLKEEFGAQYTLDGVYDLLHRLGYSCLKPRPRHRKNDVDRMREWKRSAPLLSSESKRSTRTSASKFGSRMKPGSVSRER